MLPTARAVASCTDCRAGRVGRVGSGPYAPGYIKASTGRNRWLAAALLLGSAAAAVAGEAAACKCCSPPKAAQASLDSPALAPPGRARLPEPPRSEGCGACRAAGLCRSGRRCCSAGPGATAGTIRAPESRGSARSRGQGAHRCVKECCRACFLPKGWKGSLDAKSELGMARCNNRSSGPPARGWPAHATHLGEARDAGGDGPRQIPVQLVHQRRQQRLGGALQQQKGCAAGQANHSNATAKAPTPRECCYVDLFHSPNASPARSPLDATPFASPHPPEGLPRPLHCTAPMPLPPRCLGCSPGGTLTHA